MSDKNNIFGTPRKQQTVEESDAKAKKFKDLHDKEVAAMRIEIAKFNFTIKFHNKTWVLKETTTCGFTGSVKVEAASIKPEEFGVLSIEKDKKSQCCRIHVWSDGRNDGNNMHLINVPNGAFKRMDHV